MKAAFAYFWGERQSRYHPVIPPIVAAVEVETALMKYAGLDTVIVSYWPDTDLEAILQASRLQVIPLVEREAYNPPTALETRAEVDKLWLLYRNNKKAWRHEGKPVLMVYNHWPVAEEVAARWVDANENRFYLVMRAGPNSTPSFPGVSRWYCYEPTGIWSRIVGNAVSVSPGFYKYDEPVVYPRDLAAFRYAYSWAKAAGEWGGEWVMVTTWNEWPEGSGVGVTEEWGLKYIEEMRK